VRDHRSQRTTRILAQCLQGVIVARMTAWSTGAIYYSPLPNESLRTVESEAPTECR